jgi:hypothetical protein
MSDSKLNQINSALKANGEVVVAYKDKRSIEYYVASEHELNHYAGREGASHCMNHTSLYVAPKNRTLSSPNELDSFLLTLVPGLKPDKIRKSHISWDDKRFLKFGYMQFCEKIGSEKFRKERTFKFIDEHAAQFQEMPLREWTRETTEREVDYHREIRLIPCPTRDLIYQDGKRWNNVADSSIISWEQIRLATLERVIPGSIKKLIEEGYKGEDLDLED